MYNKYSSSQHIAAEAEGGKQRKLPSKLGLSKVTTEVLVPDKFVWTAAPQPKMFYSY